MIPISYPHRCPTEFMVGRRQEKVSNRSRLIWVPADVVGLFRLLPPPGTGESKA